jgi:hypothetical protein
MAPTFLDDLLAPRARSPTVVAAGASVCASALSARGPRCSLWRGPRRRFPHLLSVTADLSYLVSKNSYKDFQIKAEFWVDEEANSRRPPMCRTPRT